MARGFLAQKSELAQKRTVHERRASIAGTRTQGMYLPQRRESAIDLETLPDLKLRLGLCARSGGNLSICRQCGAPCSFGRILMERQDSGVEVKQSAVQYQARSTTAASAQDGRSNQAKPAVSNRGKEGGNSPEAAALRREHAIRASMAAKAARERKQAEAAQKPMSPAEAEEERKRKRKREYMREYYVKHKDRMMVYNRDRKRMEVQRREEQAEAARAADREAKAARTDLPIKDTFAARLDLSMYNNGLTIADVAMELDVTEATVRSWRNGNRLPALDKAADACRMLGVTAGWLMGLEDSCHG